MLFDAKIGNNPENIIIEILKLFRAMDRFLSTKKLDSSPYESTVPGLTQLMLK
jgi:hypothetical protein